MSNELRSMAFTISVDTKDGKSITQMVSSLREAEEVTDRLTAAGFKNVRMLEQSEKSQVDLNREVRGAIREAKKQAKAVDDIKKSYQLASKAIGLTSDELEVANAQMKAGVTAASAEGQEIEKLVLDYNKLSASSKKAADEQKKSESTQKRYESTMESLNNEILKQTALLNNDEDAVLRLAAAQKLGTNATEKQIQSFINVNKQLSAMGGASGEAQRSLRNARGVAQNFGWQLQDVAVQLQAGTNGFVVLSQQGSQFASAFGAKGAVVGAIIAVAGALAGSLMPSLFKTREYAEELTGALSELEDVLDNSEGSALTLSDDMITLARSSEQLAESIKNISLAGLQAEIKDAKEGFRELAVTAADGKSKFFVFGGEIDAVTKTLQKSGQTISEYRDNLAESINNGANFGTSFESVNRTVLAELKDISNAISDVSEKYGISREEAERFLDVASQGVDLDVEGLNEFASVLDSIQAGSEFNDLGTEGREQIFDLYRRVQEEIEATKLAADVANMSMEELMSSKDVGGVNKDLEDIINNLNKMEFEDLSPVEQWVQEYSEQVKRISELELEGAISTEAANDLRVRSTELRNSRLLEIYAEEEAELNAANKRKQKIIERANNELRNEFSRLEDRVSRNTISLLPEIDKVNTKYDAIAESIVEMSMDAEKLIKAGVIKSRSELDDLLISNAESRAAEIAEIEERSARDEANKRIALEKQVQSVLDGVINDKETPSWFASADLINLNKERDELEEALMEISEIEESYREKGIEAAQEFADAKAAINEEMKNNELEIAEEIGKAWINQANIAVSVGNMLSNQVTALADMFGDGGKKMAESMEEMNAIQKAAFFFSQSVTAAGAILAGYKNAETIADMKIPFSQGLQTASIAAGYANAGAIMGVTIAGAFDKGGVIPAGQAGIVSEYGDELVGGTMVFNNSSSGLPVTGREDTAKMMGSTVINATMNISGGGEDSDALFQKRLMKFKKTVQMAVQKENRNRGRS